MESQEILENLVSFNTVNDKDNEEIINYIENYLNGYGFNTLYKSKCLVMSNCIDTNIGFLGHTDTVSCSRDWEFSPFQLTCKDDKLYGLGTCDMKGAIAAMLAAVSKVQFTGKKGIRLFFTFDEEIGFAGINELVSNRDISFPQTMIIGEPTNNEVINASKGLLELKVSFKGVEAHSSTPWEGDNAILKCVSFILKMEEYYKELKANIINGKSLTMNIGVINGGVSFNIVPSICDVSIDFRTVSENQNEEIIEKVRKLVDDEASVEIVNNIKPFISDEKDVLMSDFITEASFLHSNVRYILGVGPNNAHKKDEFITKQSLEKLEKQYIELIKDNI